MKDLTPEEAGRWMAAAPQPVQEAVMSPTTQLVIEQLGKQYALHIDVIGLLMKLSSYMLLGYAGPAEALQELRGAGVSEQQARQIIDEINKKIFVPLREKMMGVEAAVKPAEPVKSVSPSTQPSLAQSYGEARPTHFHLQNRIEHPPLPQLPREEKRSQASPTPSAAPASTLGDVVRSALATSSPAPELAPPKPVENERLLSDHEERHIDVKDEMQVASLPGTQPPVSVPLKPTVPNLAPPAGVIPPGARFSPRPAAAMPAPLSTPPAPLKPSTVPLTPSVKSYSVDPYREPIDVK